MTQMPRTYRTFDMSDYDITENGEVINRHTGRHVKPQPNGKGYLRVSIGGRLRFVHRMVAELYVQNPENKPQVNHKNGDKTDNRACNLEWVSNQENRDHAMKTGLHLQGERCSWTKLKDEDVRFIREHAEIDANQLGEMFGVTPNYVRAIRRNDARKTEKIC